MLRGACDPYRSDLGSPDRALIASSGDYSYETATRDGRLFRFRTDRDVAEADAVIVGITIEDATVRPTLDFG
ncbi:hypothetical protein [Microbacterium saperdae]|uniref:Uncharacterized protein n=1 Tax=Microbacterium saperdae TaxID=69368 RepID=A0A543BQ33_9MICO|nr:hypothetical protein [Microbacterium saperdae]TQL86941.1 hypothetical protein FB560_2606 [Microbacterium saperdae]GGM44122.1 hypothetical protein GCM10010489_14100 [Microbacterium saperdae]